MTDTKRLWTVLLPEVPVPSEQQWALWHLLHDAKTVAAGVTQLAAKYRRMGGKMDSEYVLKFASSVMNRQTRERQIA